MRKDALIIGAGPAGLAAALALSRQGLECAVLDNRRPPIDKACGEGLMPDAIESLEKLGIKLPADLGAKFDGIRFLDGKSTPGSIFPNGSGRGIRRLKLHDLLVTEAKKSGIEIHWGTAATYQGTGKLKLQRVDRSSGDIMAQARWIIGADGQNSQIRRSAGLESTLKLKTRYGFRKHYKVAPWSNFVEVHWADCGQIYVTPIGQDEVGVALCTSDPNLRIDDCLSRFPLVVERLQGAKPVSVERGAITTTRKLERVARDSVLLIGDASGSVDAVTGEGMALAFRQALALATAIKKSDISYYEQAHDAIAKLPGLMAAFLLLLDRYPALRERVFRVLDEAPQTFSRMLSVHVGHESMLHFALNEAPSFGWRLLTV